MNTEDPVVIEQFKKLPEELKKALFSDDTTENIFSIGKNNGLTEFQMEELSDETSLVILGITKPENFSGNLAKRLGIDSQKTNLIIKSVNEKILGPITVALAKFQEASSQAQVSMEQQEPKKPDIEKIVSKPSPVSAQPEPIAIKPIIPATTTADIKSVPTATIAANTTEKIPAVTAPEKVAVTEPPKPPKTPESSMPAIPAAKTEVPEVSQIFVKPPPSFIQNKPIEPVPSTSTQARPQSAPKIVNWEDVLRKKDTESKDIPSSKNALEKALNDGLSLGPQTKTEPLSMSKEVPKNQTSSNEAEIKITPQNTNSTKYVGKMDPYREPIE